MTGGWVPRWRSLLASFGWLVPDEEGTRRRRHRITDFRLGDAGIEADVRLADGQSHTVQLSLLPLPPRVFDAAIRTMAGKARFAASLLSGRIPLDVESAFAGTGRTLLPASPQEIKIACSCRAPERVCPHLRAVLPLLGERFDHDPFLLFELRGMKRAELLARLRRCRSAPSKGSGDGRDRRRAEKKSPRTVPARALATEPLPEARPEVFFKPTRPLGPPRPLLATSEGGESVLARLGPPPFQDPLAAELLVELHRAIGLGARERLAEWEWRKVSRRPGEES